MELGRQFVTKTIFNKEYFTPGCAVQILKDNNLQAGLVKSVKEEELEVVVLNEGITEDTIGVLTPAECMIHIDDATSGLIGVQKLENQIVVQELASKSALMTVYKAYLELSNTLVEQEMLANTSSGRTQDIEPQVRHDERVKAFKLLINNVLKQQTVE